VVGADVVAAFREEELSDASARGGCLSGEAAVTGGMRSASGPPSGINRWAFMLSDSSAVSFG
jgi:hypothetical protein